MRFLAHIIANAIGVILATLAVPGFVFTGTWKTLLLVALVLAIGNVIVRPILKILSLPLILITFGLFLIIINMIILKVVDYLFGTLAIATVGALFWGTLIVSLANGVLLALVKKKES